MLVIILSCLSVGLAVARNSYLVTVPNSVIPGTALSFHVTILDASSEVNIQAALKLSSNGSVVVKTEEKALAGIPTVIHLDIPESLGHSSYRVAVTGSGGLNFHKESDIFFDKDNFLFIFIQTDKFRYTAEQEVRFRVIFLNPDLRGYTGPFDIAIKDQKGNKLQQWLSRTSPDGVFSGKLLISDDPEDGTWQIVASAKGKTKIQELKVSPYTLPKFKVTIDVKKTIHSTEPDIYIDVKARFTFKQPVNGIVDLQIYNEDTPSKVISEKKTIQGQVSFEVPTKDLLDKLDARKKIIVRAMVTDEATFLTMAAETPLNIVLEYEPMTIKRWDKRDRFVPGLTYFASFSVRKNGEEIGEAGSLKIVVYSTTYRLSDCRNTHPKTKRIIYTTSKLMSKSIAFKKSGGAFFSVDTPSNSIKLKIVITGPHDSFLTYKLKRVLPSDRNKLIRLSLTSAPEIDDTANVQLSATHSLYGSAMFEVYSRNRLLSFKKKEMNGLSSVDFEFTVEDSMVPRAYVLAYYIGDDGTVTSDQLAIEVEGKRLKNLVSVKFDKETVKVRENLHLSVVADPGSIVYLLAEDERNRLLGTSNDIYLYQVNEKVDNTTYDFEGNIQNYQRHTGDKKRSLLSNLDQHKRNYDKYGDTDDAFIESGVILITDAQILEKTTIALDVYNRYSQSCPVPVWKSIALYGGSPKYKMYVASFPGSSNSIMGPSNSASVLGPNDSGNSGDDQSVSDIIRGRFPETWLWEAVQIGYTSMAACRFSPEGSLTVLKQVPDSVTSWVTSAFATNQNTGFGVAENKTKLTVFREFFVTIDMPATIIYGEEFLIQVTVFNYLAQSHQVVLAISHSDDPTDVKPQATTVGAGEGHSVFAYIRPIIHGDVTITVQAVAGMFWKIYAQDIIQRKVYVQPPGVWRETNIPQMVDITASTFTKTLYIEDHPNMVPKTKTLKLSLTGDFMLPSVPSIEGLQDFIRLPRGCGEQTMLRFAPNTYIIEYLKAADKLTAAILLKSKGFMESGYQRELTYQRSDGSFSAFGNRDRSGSSWLTAFVLKCFHEAKDQIFIDDKVMTKAMGWLLTTQKASGEFAEPGRVIHTEMQSGTRSDIKITAFIVISLLENSDLKLPDTTELPGAITKGITYIESNLRLVRDTYTLSLVCYALSMGQSSKTKDCGDKLRQSAKQEDGTLHWTSNTRVSISKRDFNKRSGKENKRAPAKDIEATAYALLFYLLEEKPVESFQIVKWLVSQRNPRGGYLSTQDTVISLQAISRYATFRSGDIVPENFGIDIKITADGFEYTYQLMEVNKDILHVKELPGHIKEIEVKAEGTGTALIEVFSGYFVTALPGSDVLNVNASIKTESLNSITVITCTSWLGKSQSGMLVMEVELPTGFVPDEDLLKSQSLIKRQEAKGKAVNLYFDGLPAGGQMCIEVKSDRADPVVKSQACHITVYDYYEPGNQAMTEYDSGVLKTTNICDVCYECNFCENPLR